MPEAIIPFVKGDSAGRPGFAADYFDRLPENMYTVHEPHLETAYYILTYPGIADFGTGIGNDRGGIWNERQLNHFRVSGLSFIEVDENGDSTILGTVTGTEQVSLARSFNTQAIVGDNKYFLYDPDNGFRQIIDPNVGNPIDVTWVDGYYFFTDGENLYHTTLADEEVIEPLGFATAEFSPDPTLAVAKDKNNQVIAFNRFSIEYFRNVASAGFAFQRISSKAQKIGIVGTYCQTELDGVFFILGGRKEEDVSFHILQTGSTIPIATREIDRIVDRFTEEELSTVILEARGERNSKFLIAHFPDITLLYNHTVGQKLGPENAWSILKTDVEGDVTYQGINGIFDTRNSEWIYGDKGTARLGRVDENIATYHGERVESIFYTPLVTLETASIDEVYLETVPGFVSTTATLAMSITYNGFQFSQEFFELYSEPQTYSVRYFIRRVGYVRHRIGWKFRNSSTEKMAFNKFKITYG